MQVNLEFIKFFYDKLGGGFSVVTLILMSSNLVFVDFIGADWFDGESTAQIATSSFLSFVPIVSVTVFCFGPTNRKEQLPLWVVNGAVITSAFSLLSGLFCVWLELSKITYYVIILLLSTGLGLRFKSLVFERLK